MRQRGWRKFKCDGCDHEWEWPAPDHTSPIGVNCPKCKEWEVPRSSRPDNTIPHDNMWNITIPLNTTPDQL